MAADRSGGNSSGVDSCVIVAIPSKDSYVWNLSSEKVPHLTLMYLANKFEDLSQVEEYIAHVVNTSLYRFYLDVDRRGVLGDESADVLFFSRYGTKMLEDVRSYLLLNKDIFQAYNAVSQYPLWTPHLTLGYPQTPAKPDNRDYPGIHSVAFDRIALWTGDYEGVEFALKDSRDDELKMADKGRDFLEHYGIKGMRWGVTRSQAAKAGAMLKDAYTPSRDALDAQKFQTKAKLGGVRAMSNQEMRKVIARMELEQRYRDLYGERQYHDEAVSRARRYTMKGARWAGRIINDILTDAGSSWLKRPGSNASGRTTSRWNNAQQVGNIINGSVVEPRSIGR